MCSGQAMNIECSNMKINIANNVIGSVLNGKGVLDYSRACSFENSNGNVISLNMLVTDSFEPH